MSTDKLSTINPSRDYFERVAEDWDSLRKGYFTEAVRETAIEKSYLRSDMEVADVGAGTGFMAAGLAPRVRKVHVVDGSAAMLAVARSNLAGFKNVEFHEAEGQSLPFSDASLDAVFANMYLHHCPDPQAALNEMARVLKPGGRLTITDMDAHSYTWLKEEMADVWMGFERPQIRQWLEGAGLVNAIVDCTGQDCCAKSENTELDASERQVNISVFYATGTRRMAGMKEEVRQHYGALAESGSCGCSSTADSAGNSCCSTSAEQSGSSSCSSSDLLSLDEIGVSDIVFQTGYTPEQQAGIPEEASSLFLGCGNPTAMAGLKPGEVVVDIGSGAGMDALLAARQVGPQGKVIGVDMTPAMLERARRALAKAGHSNVEFRQGSAEALPVEDDTVDVILSNCVINLVEDKGKVFAEAFRILKPGGRLEISDVVLSGPAPLALLQGDSWAGCVSGALPETEYRDLVAQAGFTRIKTHRGPSGGQLGDVQGYSVYLEAYK